MLELRRPPTRLVKVLLTTRSLALKHNVLDGSTSKEIKNCDTYDVRGVVVLEVIELPISKFMFYQKLLDIASTFNEK